MKNKKIYLTILLLFLVCILSISAISATGNTTNKEIISDSDNKESNLQINIQYDDDVSTSKENYEHELEENNNKDKSRTGQTSTANVDSLTFTDLNTTINGNSNSTIYLSNNYKYNNASDNNFKVVGILINRDLTIYGNGVTIDGSHMARIFGGTRTIEVHNINFINGQSYYGGALLGINAYNCTFINNTAENGGGAMFEGNAYNCTFTNNTAKEGGAIYGVKYPSNVYNCTFINNTAENGGGAMFLGNAYNCTFTDNMAKEGGAIYGAKYPSNAYNCTFINNTAENGGGAMFLGNAYNCTFTDNMAKEGGAIYYTDAYNCTFTNNTAEKGGAIYGYSFWRNAYNCTFIKNNALSGIAIYNGNAYDSLFICYYAPKSEIVYNGTIENCTFQYIKLATKITASPVTTSYYISKMLIITLKDANGNPITNELVTVNLDSAKKYKTNSKGQVKIQVGALTPKTYNAKITYEGSDLYNGSTASVKVTVKKSTPKITANAVKYNGKTKQFKVYFLTGHMKHHALKSAQVSLKVNGKTYTVKTNSKGQGIFNINKLKKGKYSAVLSILSNNYYNKVTKNVIINVKK